MAWTGSRCVAVFADRCCFATDVVVDALDSSGVRFARRTHHMVKPPIARRNVDGVPSVVQRQPSGTAAPTVLVMRRCLNGFYGT